MRRDVCVEGQRVSTMKSVPLPVSEPSPLSEMMSEAPGDISSEIRASASGGMATRASASLAFDAGPTTGAAGSSRRLPFTDFLTGSGLAPGIDTTFQRSVVLSSLTAKAVKTWVPSGRFGSSNVTGASNTGSKPLRTNSLPSLRLMNTEIGPGLSGFGSAGLRSGPVVSRGVASGGKRFGDQYRIGCLPVALGSAELRQSEGIGSAAHRLRRIGLRFALRLGRLALDGEQALVGDRNRSDFA